ERSDSQYIKWTIWLIAGSFLFRVIYPLLFPVNLAGDEAYYWEWGRRPDIGYFSKPPLIAWIYTAADFIGSGSLYGIRIFPVLFGTGSMIVTWALARKMFDARTGFYATLLVALFPGNSLLNLVLTIDAPLVLFWALSLFFFWKAVKHEGGFLTYALLFLFIGLGHLSKQMMLFFPALAIIYLLTGRETRAQLKKPLMWLALIGSLVFLAPPLIWNSQNDWITFNHMSTHVGAQSEELSTYEMLSDRLGDFAEFFGSQLGALTPIFFFIVIVTSFTGQLVRKNFSPKSRFFFVFCGAPFVAITIVSMTQKVQANWPAVFYIAGAIAAATWFAEVTDALPLKTKIRQRFLRIGTVMSIVISCFFYFASPVFKAIGQEGHKLDPNRRLLGSAGLAAAIHEVRQTIPEDHFIICAGHRYNTSRLAFELPDQPLVYRWNGGKYIDSQYELWPGPWAEEREGQTALIVQPFPGNRVQPGVGSSFEKITHLGEVKVEAGVGRTKLANLFLGENLIKPLGDRPK
ncbi:MAG: glycosyltransferase family 39 protein, partial [Verrucomicrobiota bacterium]